MDRKKGKEINNKRGSQRNTFIYKMRKSIKERQKHFKKTGIALVVRKKRKRKQGIVKGFIK